MQKCNKYKKQYEKDQQTIKCLFKKHRKSLQGHVIDKKESESLCNIFKKHVDEKKNNLFYSYEHKWN